MAPSTDTPSINHHQHTGTTPTNRPTPTPPTPTATPTHRTGPRPSTRPPTHPRRPPDHAGHITTRHHSKTATVPIGKHSRERGIEEGDTQHHTDPSPHRPRSHANTEAHARPRNQPPSRSRQPHAATTHAIASPAACPIRNHRRRKGIREGGRLPDLDRRGPRRRSRRRPRPPQPAFTRPDCANLAQNHPESPFAARCGGFLRIQPDPPKSGLDRARRRRRSSPPRPQHFATATPERKHYPPHTPLTGYLESVYSSPLATFAKKILTLVSKPL